MLLCSWNSPGKNSGVGFPFPSPGDLPTQGSNPHLLLGRILHHWDKELIQDHTHFHSLLKGLKVVEGTITTTTKNKTKQNKTKKHRADIRFLIFRSQWICLLLGIFLFSSNRYPFCRNVIPFQTEINLFFPHFTAINLFVFIINQQEWTLTTICHSLQTIIWVHMLKPDFLDFHPIIVIYQLCDIWEIT